MTHLTKKWALKFGPNGNPYVQSLWDPSFAMSISAFLNPSHLNTITLKEKEILRKVLAARLVQS